MHPPEIHPQNLAHGFEGRRLDDPQFKRFAETQLQRRFVEWPPAAWDLDLLLTAAIYYRPALDIDRARLQLARASIVTAGARPNPVFNVVPQFTTNAAAGVSPWLLTPTIDLPIEVPGKRGSRIDRARYLTDASRQDLSAAIGRLRGRILEVALSYEGLRQRALLSNRKRDLAARLARELEVRMTAGAASQTDVLTAESQAAEATLAWERAREAVEQSCHDLAQLLGVPASALAQVTIAVRPLSWPPSEQVDRRSLRRLALTHRTDLLARLAEYHASCAALREQLIRRYPDLHVGPGYEFDQGANRWALGFSVELPVFNRNEGPIAEAEARRVEAAARFRTLQAQVISEVDRALAEAKRLKDQARIAHRLAGLRKTLEENARAGFAAGAIGRPELLTAEIQAVEAALADEVAEMAAALAVAKLEAVTQSPLPRDVHRGAAPESKSQRPL